MGIIDFSDLDLKRGPLADADMLVGNNAVSGISDPHLVPLGSSGPGIQFVAAGRDPG